MPDFFMNIKEKLNAFGNVILKDALLKRHKKIHEFEQQQKKIYAEIEANAEKEAEEKIKIEREKVEKLKNQKITQSTSEARKALFDYRNMSITKVFENVTEKLNMFIETDEYVASLLKNIEIVKKQYEENVEIRVCKRDMKYKEVLEKMKGVVVNEVNEGDEIIGGFVAYIKDRNIILDYSYDEGLREARKSFDGFSM